MYMYMYICVYIYKYIYNKWRYFETICNVNRCLRRLWKLVPTFSSLSLSLSNCFIFIELKKKKKLTDICSEAFEFQWIFSLTVDGEKRFHTIQCDPAGNEYFFQHFYLLLFSCFHSPTYRKDFIRKAVYNGMLCRQASSRTLKSSWAFSRRVGVRSEQFPWRSVTVTMISTWRHCLGKDNHVLRTCCRLTSFPCNDFSPLRHEESTVGVGYACNAIRMKKRKRKRRHASYTHT